MRNLLNLKNDKSLDSNPDNRHVGQLAVSYALRFRKQLVITAVRSSPTEVGQGSICLDVEKQSSVDNTGPGYTDSTQKACNDDQISRTADVRTLILQSHS
jgi:hypothetical protein